MTDSIRLFIIEGIATVVFSIPAAFILPNYPATTKWLSEQERALAVWRLTLEAGGEEDDVKDSVWKGLKDACADPKVWLLVFIQTSVTFSMRYVAHPSLIREKFADSKLCVASPTSSLP